MTFELYPLRFSLVARDAVRFPEGKAANTLRGALGLALRQIACVPPCGEPKRCERRFECDYAKYFEPFGKGAGPSGLADWPRPFVLRAAHLDGARFERGQIFDFGLHLFAVRDPVVPRFAEAVAELAAAGFGPAQGRAELAAVTGMEKLAIDLATAGAARAARVRFVTPVELKSAGGLAARPEFGVLFARIRDRLSVLRALYGEGPLDVDFDVLGRRAAAVRMTQCAVRRVTLERRSSKSGTRHPLGGFTGEAEYEGEMGEFVPYLEAARWTGVGRQTVWGKGQVEVEWLG